MWLLSRLPERPAMLLARSIVWVALLLLPRSHRVARRNLELVFPNLDQARREQIRRESYRVLALNLLDFARLPKLNGVRAREMIDFEPAGKIVRQLRQEFPDVGILIPMMHFGSVEIFAQFTALLLEPTAILARGFGFPRLDRWWNSRRELFGSEMFDRKGGYKEMVARLSRGQSVGILADQNVKANHAVFVPFFGIQAATTKSIALAAIQTGSPILVAACWQSSFSRYDLDVERIAAETAEDSGLSNGERVAKITERINAAFERIIRAHPEQWFWIHRRWKTRPPGEAETLYGNRA